MNKHSTGKPEFLYYGSSERMDIIRPLADSGGRSAVHAFAVKEIALAYALGIVPDTNGEQDRVMDYKFAEGKAVMIYLKGRPNLGGKGYLYKLSSDGFTSTGGTQWVCPIPVTPLAITEINVDEYLYLCRYPTEEERRQIEENFTER